MDGPVTHGTFTQQACGRGFQTFILQPEQRRFYYAHSITRQKDVKVYLTDVSICWRWVEEVEEGWWATNASSEAKL